jgi:hypothetical protein
MLSVGRQFDLEGMTIFCKACLWDGVSTILKTKLIPIGGTRLLFYIFHSPYRASDDLAVRGKLLNFTMQNFPADAEVQNSLVDSRPLFDNGKSKKKCAC